MKTIEIIIDKTGNSTVQTKGFVSSSCREASKLIELALGVVQSEMPTTEMYQPHLVDQPVQENHS